MEEENSRRPCLSSSAPNQQLCNTLDYSYPGQSPAVKQQIVAMAMNASGIRDTARVLHVSTNTVMTELKKGTCAPARKRAPVTGPASRAGGGGGLPL
jgi:hypothetical protein